MAIAATMPAITHVAVTVTDLAASEAWYTKVLGVTPVLDEDTGPFRHIVFPIGNTLFGLHGFPRLVSSEPFDERRPGLDHVAVRVASRDELVRLGRAPRRARHPPRRDHRRRYGSGLSFRDPDNIQLELFAPPGPHRGPGSPRPDWSVRARRGGVSATGWWSWSRPAPWSWSRPGTVVVVVPLLAAGSSPRPRRPCVGLLGVVIGTAGRLALGPGCLLGLGVEVRARPRRRTRAGIPVAVGARAGRDTPCPCRSRCPCRSAPACRSRSGRRRRTSPPAASTAETYSPWLR